MKNLIKIIIFCLIPAVAWGQSSQFIRNENLATLTGTELGPGNAAITRKGALYCVMDGTAQPSNATGLLKPEDGAAASGDNGVQMLAVAKAQIVNATQQRADGDYGSVYQDDAGRLYVNAYGTDVGTFFASCGTATASTADVAIKAAVASNRMYVTSINCKSTSATVATSIDFKDGSTVVAVGGISQMAAGAPGDLTKVFPTPLRGTANTVFNFATNVATTSVTCCAQGYISTL